MYSLSTLSFKRQLQQGQTLIETLVAIFVLVMGITAATGLAIYGLNASSNISNQIIATGLAREGLEAVKNMRDTNWLKDNLSSNCYNFASSPVGQNTAHCYDNWLTGPSSGGIGTANGYDLSPSGGLRPNTLALRVETNRKIWNLVERANNTTNVYGLNLGQNISNVAFAGYYVPSGNASATSGFYRRIVLQESTPSSSFQNELELLTVTVEVWWRDIRKCNFTPAAVYNYDTAPVSCRLRLRTYLTNWKNYEIVP